MIVTLDEAVKLIKKGEVVAFPTETVYGLGADAQNIQAVKKTFRLKGRPLDNPLILHISNVDQVEELTINRPDDFDKLADSFWPGPLTIITEKSDRVPDLVTGGLSTVALRMPNHPLALDLIEQTGPLTAPSANKSGKPSPTRTDHLIQDYGDELYILEGGATEIGIESTIIDLTSSRPTILRPGAITAKKLSDLLSKNVQGIDESEIDMSKPAKSPGVKYSHYKPEATVNWFDTPPANFPDEILFIVHSSTRWPESDHIISYNQNFHQLAKELYDLFRTADHLQYREILIEKLPPETHHPMIAPLFNRISKAVGRQ